MRDDGRESESIAILDEARQAGVDSPLLLEQLGYLLLAAGETERALSIAEPAYDAARPHAGLVLVVGLSLARTEERRSEAVRWLEQAIDLGARNQPTAHLAAANILLDENRALAAIEHYRAAEEMVPDSPDVYYGLSQALEAAGDSEGAAQARERFTQLTGSSTNPIDADAQTTSLNEANQLAFENRLDEALALVDSILRERPTWANAHLTRGKILYAKDRSGDALRAVIEARTLDSSLSEAYYLEGLFLSTTNRPAEAEAPLRRSVELDPELGVGWALLGASLSKQKKAAEAAEHFQRALDLGTDSAFLRLGYASVLETLGRTQEAAGQTAAYRRLK